VSRVAVTGGYYSDRNTDSIRDIYYIQLDQSYPGEGSILLVTSLPHPSVKVNVQAIMNEQSRSLEE